MRDGDVLDLAGPDDAARVKGQAFIQRRWRYLLPATRDTLRACGFYTDRGAPIAGAETTSAEPEHDVERLEYALGVVSACASALLPARDKKGAQIPCEATSHEVLEQCGELVAISAWRDPEFLRLGLRAVSQYQRAEAQYYAGVPRRFGAALGCVGAILYAALLFLSPTFLAVALVAASEGSTAGTAAGLYGVALTVMFFLWFRDKTAGKHISTEERAYQAWTHFQGVLDGAPLGVGARAELAAMWKKGVKVPGLAVDLCAALEARI